MNITKRQICQEVQSWLVRPPLPIADEMPADMYTHIESCKHCRGALALLTTELFQQETVEETYSSCGECQIDLAVYIDLVQEQNESAAARRYPHVWSHLLTCQECMETYDMTTALVQAEARGEIPSLHAVFMSPNDTRKQLFTFQPTFVLSRSYMLQAFPPRHMGLTREDTPFELSLVDQDVHRYDMHVSVSPIDEESCRLSITTQPVANGHVSVSVGDFVIRAPLDQRGIALLDHFPLKFLRESHGPDLIVKLET